MNTVKRLFIVTLQAHEDGAKDVSLLLPRTEAEVERIRESARRSGYHRVHLTQVERVA